MARQEFPLPPMPAVWVWLVLPALAVVVIAIATSTADPTPGPRWLLAPLMVALVLVAPLLALRRRGITLDGRELTVAAAFYTRKVTVDALDLDKARVVDLAEHTEYAPMLGLNRLGLPGFRAGHYLLRNRTRAFCLLIGRERALVLPQRDGRVLLLTPQRPQELLQRLRDVAASAQRR